MRGELPPVAPPADSGSATVPASYSGPNNGHMEAAASSRMVEAVDRLTATRHFYRRVGYDARPMEFHPDGRIGAGSSRLESEWRIHQLHGEVYLEIRCAAESTCFLKLEEGGIWCGRWERFERMPVEVYPQPAAARVNREIDVVYTWVDGDASAPALRALLDRESAPVLRGAATDNRFRSIGELQYSLRSLHTYAPWVRRVFLVTDGKTPPWLNVDCPKLRLVSHAEIFEDSGALPTFNSHAIELNLHRIPGLGPAFLYFNDDFLLGQPVCADDFVSADGVQSIFFTDWNIPRGKTEQAHDRAYEFTLQLLDRAYGSRPRKMLAHVPQLYRVDVLERICELWQAEVKSTFGNRFRSGCDVVLRILYAYYLLESPAPGWAARSVILPQGKAYIFAPISTNGAHTRQALSRVAKDRPKFLCLNDEISREGESFKTTFNEVRLFLAEQYQCPSPFERRPAADRSGILPELNDTTASDHVRSAILQLPQTARDWQGRGIVICGGGMRYFLCAWVCINMLRKQGCHLPVELWHLNDAEMNDTMRTLVEPLGVTCINAQEVRKLYPARILNGWEIKAFALLHSAFREVLLLDADNVPVVDPTFLFETKQFEETGALFWPDFPRLEPSRSIWGLTGVTYREEPEFESGQIVLDKARCFRPLSLAMWFNEYSDFWYRHIHGDKETFHMAWRRLDAPYAMPQRGIHALPCTMCQHDFNGRRIFQHRNLAKWSLRGNPQIPGFSQEPECLSFIEQLVPYWTRISPVSKYSPAGRSLVELQAAQELIGRRWLYERVGHDRRQILLQADGTVGEGGAKMEIFWDITQEEGVLSLKIQSDEALTCRLIRTRGGVWQGRWENFERMPVLLVPADLPAGGFAIPGLSAAEPESGRVREAFEQLTGTRHKYCRVGYDARLMVFKPDGSIGEGRDQMELRWELHELGDRMLLDIWSSSEITCRLELAKDGVWRGKWESFEQMPVEVYPELSKG